MPGLARVKPVKYKNTPIIKYTVLYSDVRKTQFGSVSV